MCDLSYGYGTTSTDSSSCIGKLRPTDDWQKKREKEPISLLETLKDTTESQRVKSSITRAHSRLAFDDPGL